ncbi:MAG: hypothetical protein IJ309_06370 [Clostridia bacterium]|nr:hypothetical protein [Clostridia bacterium]
MRYTKPSYTKEVIASEEIMEFSPNNIYTTNENFDFGDGEQAVTKGTSTANIKDLLF